MAHGGSPSPTPAPAPVILAAEADYSFAVEYKGPPLPYAIPRAIPIEVDHIPVAAVADSPPSSAEAVGGGTLALPVVHPLPSPKKLPPQPKDAPSEPPSAASPTSVIETHAAMDVLDADVCSSGALGSSGCPDRSTELSEVVDDSSGAMVAFSCETLKAGEDEEEEEDGDVLIPRRLSSESVLSSEFDFRSSASGFDEDDALAGHAKKAMLVTFHESGRSSGSGSPAVATVARTEMSEESKLKIKKGACHRCLKGRRFTEKEACLACDAKYCSGCILRAMGSMPEGRKCVTCIGSAILESKRDKLGKSSRLLKKLLSSLEVQQVTMAEKNCEANQLRPRDICVNGKKLSSEEMVLLQTCACPPSRLKPGYYWYDKVSGYWGKEGYKPDKIITPHLNVGGTLMQNASNGNTGIIINGREITKVELQMLKWAGVQCAGNPHFWLNADGSYLEEGQKTVKGNIWEKPIMKLVCPVLSLPIPSNFTGSSNEEANNLAIRVVPDYFEQKALEKLLLIGYHGSGKSTIFKQAKFLYRSVSFSEDERQDIKLMIQNSIYRYLGILLEGRERFEEESLAERRKGQQLLSSGKSEGDSNDKTKYSIGQRLKTFSDWLLKAMACGNLEDIFPAATREHALLVEELWNDAAIQATYSRRNELHWLPSAASYFLERVVDISRVDYEPSDADILYAAGLTSSNGLASVEFTFPPLSVASASDDADQQDLLLRYQLLRLHTKGLGENCKWLDMLEDVRMVIFCVDLSDYDAYYENTNGEVMNKMMESKRLFERIASHPMLDQTAFLLILNKFDLLEQKIDSAPLTLCDLFDDFNPVVSRPRSSNTNSRSQSHSSTLAQQATYYIAIKFKRLFFNITGRKLYATQVNALQTDSVDAALRYAREIIRWEERRQVLVSNESVYSTEPSSFSH